MFLYESMLKMRGTLDMYPVVGGYTQAPVKQCVISIRYPVSNLDVRSSLVLYLQFICILGHMLVT